MFTLLYVDDEPGLLELGQLFLESSGEFKVTTALSGEEALRYLSEQDFDAIVSDYQMPEMNGLEFLRRIRKSFGNLPFILFTGRGREEVVIEAINNGVDFYLQKGGDPKSQFAELAHKIRQALSRRKAEIALSDSEKRLADIINFLPDATFAIDTDGKVITWNRAIEEMTGVPAADMVGKGDYEYAVPFYNSRRPILIDLIFEPEDVIAKKYANITRHKDILSADTTLPHPKGMQVTLMGVAGPLYNRKGKLIGSIESIRDITDRKKAEEALRQSEERYRKLAEISPDAILVHQDGRIVYANPATLRLVGASRYGEIAGKPLMEFIQPESRDLVSMNIQSDMRSEHSPAVEVRMLRLDGQSVIVEGSGVLTTHEGRPAVQVAIRDITERKVAEEKIRESEQKYRTVFETTGTAMVLIEDDATISLANSEFLHLTGFDRSEIEKRKKWTDFVVKEDLERMFAQHRLRRSDPKSALKNYEFRLVTQSGEIHDIYLSVDIIPGTKKSVASLLDITDRKKAETDLIAVNKEYLNLLDQIQDIYYRSDTQGRLVRASRSFATLLGYDDITECLGKNIADSFYFNPSDRERLLEELERHGKVSGYEVLLKKKDRTQVLIEASSHNYFDSAGNVIGVEGTFRDITERKRAEDELRAANEQLVASDEELRAQYEEIAQSEKRIRLSETRLTFMLGFYDYAQKSEKELLAYAIEGAGIVTGSPLGYLAFLNEDESELSMYAWSKNAMAECSMREKPIVYKTEKTGLWGEAVRQRRAVITNDYAAPNPAKKGYPEGHPHIYRHMNVPVIEDGHIVLVAGVANKTSEYTDNDANELLLLMQGLWTILKRRRVEEEQRLLKISVDQSADEIFWMDFEGRFLYVNEAACRINGYSRDEFLKMTIYDLNPDLTPAIWSRSITDLRQRKTQLITTRHKRKDGTMADVEIMAVYVNRDRREYSFAFVRDITDRKLAEIVLADSERKYRTLFETADEGIWTIDAGLRTTSVNKKMQEMFGFTEQEMLGRPVWDFVPSVDVESMKQVLLERRTGVPGRYERRWVRKDGTTIWCFTSATPLFSPDGIFIGSFGMFTDITERRRAEAALRESESKFRAVIDQSFGFIGLMTPDGMLIESNRAALALIGIAESDVINRPFWETPWWSHSHKLQEKLKDAIYRASQGETMRFEATHPAADGHLVSVDFSIKPVLDPAGKILYLIPEGRDISDRKLAEEALRESSRKYAELFELGSEAIFLIDNETGALLEANAAACEMYGYPRDILLTMKNTDLSAESEETKKVTTSSPPGVVRVPVRYHRRKDGTVFPVEIIGRFFVWNGRPVHIAAIRDITEHKRAEAALVESEEKYRTLVEVNRDIIYSLSPDGIVLYVSPQTITLLGYRPDEMVGRNFSDFVHPDDAEKLVRHIREHSDAGKPVPSDRFRVRRNDGTYRWFEDKTIYATDPRGNIIVAGTIRDITEEKAVQDALRESEEKFRALVEATSDFIWEVDAAGKYTYVSPQVRHILGYEPGDLVGRTPFDIMPRDEAEKISAEFNHIVTSRLPITGLENKAIRKDGSVVILETSGVVRTANDGSFLGYRGIDRDITVRKQADEALRESEARLSSILHGSPVLQFVIDRDHRVISWNNALEEYSGIRAADIIGTDHQWRAFYPVKRPVLADLLIDGDTDAISRLYEGKFRKSRYIEGAYEATDFFPPMGRSGIWLSFTAAPIRDEREGVIGAVETLEDVTERINAENALRDSEERTRTILNTAQAGIVLVDAVTHQIVDANKKALELIGLDRDSVVGTICHRFICPAERGKCPVTDLGQQVNTSERVLITANGEKIPVLKTVVPVLLSGRNVLVESFVDISEQKRSEAAIREANRKLNLLNSITRHDIRNQIMIAQGFTQLAALNRPDPVVTDFLAKIGGAIETIYHQIEFTKTYQELGGHAPAWFPVEEVIGRVRPGKTALKNTCTSVEIFADPMIDKVFFNLFDNAIKHGKGVTAVTVGFREGEDGLVITFADNGCGIPPGEKQKIFEKGYGKNTGLGLFLAREILAITGITIQETGTPGKGAVFEIIIPEGAYRKTQ